MIRTIVVAACAALALGVAGVAGASQGNDRVVDRFAGPYALAVDCAEFGPYAFEVLVEGTERGSVTDVFDSEGTLVRTDVHISFQETNTNSVTGTAFSLKGHVHVVFDYASNTRTLTGVVFMGKGHEGKAFQDTGRIVLTLDTNEPRFVAGPHDVFFGGGIDRIGCVTLAGG